MRWKTIKGEVLELSEMTDEHVANALRYEYRKRSRYSHVCGKLDDELSRRHDKKFNSQTKDCPFCEGTMKIVTVKSDPEEGVGMGWISHRYSCRECGGKSGLMEKPTFKSPLNEEEENKKNKVKPIYYSRNIDENN